MENNQNTQHQPSESNYSPPSRSKRELRQLDRSYFLAKLIQHRPWLLWLGVAAFLFTIIYISILSITQTGYVKNEEPAPVVSTKPTATSSQGSPVPLWLLGTVVLGCAAGAVAIAKRPQSAAQLSQLYQRFQSTSKKAILRRRERKLLLQHQQPMPNTPPVVASETTETVPQASMQAPPDILLLEFTEQPLPEGTTFSSEDQILDLRESEEESQLKEKILPILENQLFNLEQSQPEDEAFVSNTESLAEMLDIRKKIPLSAILGESVQLERKN